MALNRQRISDDGTGNLRLYRRGRCRLTLAWNWTLMRWQTHILDLALDSVPLVLLLLAHQIVSDLAGFSRAYDPVSGVSCERAASGALGSVSQPKLIFGFSPFHIWS